MNKINALVILSMLFLTELSNCQEYINAEDELKIEALYKNDSDYSDDNNVHCEYDLCSEENCFNKEKKYINTDPLSPPPLPDDLRKKLAESRPDLFLDDSHSPLPEEWIVESCLEQAPPLLKGILSYLETQSRSTRYSNPFFIPSCQRLILVGPPGSGKTTLAHAIASKLECPAILIPATSLLGHFRNHTANNISTRLERYTSTPYPVVIIIDELHKLFEHHEHSESDDSQSAAAFWLFVDQMEKHCSHAILICTANDVTSLPPEIKSRFAGKVIEMLAPTRQYKIKTFKQAIRHDGYTYLDRSIDNAFILKMIDQLPSSSFRDIRLLIDTAKMFFYEENPLYDRDEENYPMVLTKKQFQKAFNQLKTESSILAGSLSQQFIKNVEKWGAVFMIAANITMISRTLYDYLK